MRGAVQQIERFASALAEVLNDITALEVNTMVVSEITGTKFLPEDAYQALYKIYSTKQEEIRYEPIRRSFEGSCRDCMKKMQVSSDSVSMVPDPNTRQGRAMVDRLLAEGDFLRSLRKLSELAALMGGDRAGQNNIADIIYAQTVIQIDGDVINRFHEQLLSQRLSREDKDFLIRVHSEAVISGEENWRGLLKFLFGLVQDIISRGRRSAGAIPPSPNEPNS
jgi:hypothetical protein